MIRALLLLFCLGLLCGCNSLFYYPDPWIRLTPADLGLKYEPKILRGPQGNSIAVWVIEPTPPARGTVVHFHGNAENMSSHLNFVSWLPARGYRTILFDYRGYGDSGGKPNRQGMINDSVTVLKWVHQNAQWQDKPFFVLAQSLGGAVAVAALSEYPENQVRALVLESTFSSYRSIAKDKLSELALTWPLQWPLSFLVSDGGSPKDVMPSWRRPVWFLHSEDDPVVPISQGWQLYQQADPEHRRWTTVQLSGHTPCFGKPTPYRDTFIQYLENASSINLSRYKD